jgi:NADH:ubiquinone oxidoreductase subunit 4 (subunit M)
VGERGFYPFFFFSCFILGFLFVSFSSRRFLLFYFFFEVTFLVLYLYVCGWGYREDRLLASFYMIFYTLVVSFPFLLYLMVLSFCVGDGFFLFGFHRDWWFFCILVFLVKLPVYGLHL